MPRIEDKHKLTALLLAAGGSSRMGRPKQLIRVEGESLVRRMTRRLVALNSGDVMVVTGSNSQAISDELSGLPIQLVSNPGWKSGMASSLAAGVKSLPDECEGVLILLCDQWQIDLNDLRELVHSWRVDISRISTACWHDEGRQVIGPPAIFPRTLFEELITLKGDRGARVVIEKHREQTSIVEMESACFDLDEPADLARGLDPGNQ